MFLRCCVQTLRKDLEKGKPCSGWEDLLAVRCSGKQLWCTQGKGEDFLNLRCWKLLLGTLHIFYVTLGEVLWPWFCTRREKGSVATDLSGIWIRTLVTPYVSHLGENFLLTMLFQFTDFAHSAETVQEKLPRLSRLEVVCCPSQVSGSQARHLAGWISLPWKSILSFQGRELLVSKVFCGLSDTKVWTIQTHPGNCKVLVLPATDKDVNSYV